nr:hypothetical protein [uncultured Caldimonas sp.]
MRFALVLAAAIALPMAASGQSPQEHAAHHPDAASAPAAPTGSPSTVRPAAPAAPMAGPIDTQMQSMREMHDKMAAAKSPEERQALMAQHMKVMQDGMAMMGEMRSGKAGMPMTPEMMGRRMDMMEMMMQMMMDREAARMPAPK